MSATSPAPRPPSFRSPSEHRRPEVALALLLAVAIVGIFWGGQRYPVLLKKLHAGQSLTVSGAISFDALLQVAPTMPLAERVERTSASWLWTNRFGMYFALPFGAALMTFLAGTKRPQRFEHTAANVLGGAVAGAPMGIAPIGATPIGQKPAGFRGNTRFTLAAMISSPSFNPVVVVMAFLLFPWPMAAARVLVPLLHLLALPRLVSDSNPTMRTAKTPDWTGAKSRSPGSVVAISFLRNPLRLTFCLARSQDSSSC